MRRTPSVGLPGCLVISTRTLLVFVLEIVNYLNLGLDLLLATEELEELHLGCDDAGVGVKGLVQSERS